MLDKIGLTGPFIAILVLLSTKAVSHYCILYPVYFIAYQIHDLVIILVEGVAPF